MTNTESEINKQELDDEETQNSSDDNEEFPAVDGWRQTGPGDWTRFDADGKFAERRMTSERAKEIRALGNVVDRKELDEVTDALLSLAPHGKRRGLKPVFRSIAKTSLSGKPASVRASEILLGLLEVSIKANEPPPLNVVIVASSVVDEFERHVQILEDYARKGKSYDDVRDEVPIALVDSKGKFLPGSTPIPAALPAAIRGSRKR